MGEGRADPTQAAAYSAPATASDGAQVAASFAPSAGRGVAAVAAPGYAGPSDDAGASGAAGVGGAPPGNGVPPGGLQAGDRGPALHSGPFPSVNGGQAASPNSGPMPSVQGGPPSYVNGGPFSSVDGGRSSPLDSGPVPSIDSGGIPQVHNGSSPAVNGAPPARGPGAAQAGGPHAGFGGRRGGANPPANGAARAPNGTPGAPQAWGGGPGVADGPPQGGPATGYPAWGADDASARQAGGAPPAMWRGPRPPTGPGGPGPWRTGGDPRGMPPGSGPPSARWEGGPPEGAVPGRRPTPWGPDVGTDPDLRGPSGPEGRGNAATDEAVDAPVASPSTRNGRADGLRKRRRPNPRRNQNLPAVPALAPPDSDSAFVNGGAVYTDSYQPRQESADDAPDAAATHRINGPVPPRDDPGRPGPMRRRAARGAMLDPGQTGPIEAQQAVDDGGPSTAVGLAPAGAEAWHQDRTSRRGARDGGPATEASAPFDFDDDDEDEAVDDLDKFDQFAADSDPDDHPAGLAAEPRRRRAHSSAPSSAGQAWVAVVAQWIAGAIGGAALWVGFRFLWRDLQVVALAAAVLVTVGLVLVVRALMHNDDRRTTLFAVLVGLLLTVSPAILVLLGR